MVRREPDREATDRRDGGKGHPVGWTELIQESAGRLDQPPRVAKSNVVLIDHEDDQPPRRETLVGAVVRRRLGSLDRAGRVRWIPDRYELDGDDPTFLVVDRDRELRRFQIGHRVALAVDHPDVDLDQLDAAAKRRLLRLGARQRGKQQEHERGSGDAHGCGVSIPELRFGGSGIGGRRHRTARSSQTA